MTPNDETLPFGAPPDVVDPPFEALLAEPFASAWAHRPGASEVGAPGVPERLRQRLSASRAATRRMFTARHARLPREALGTGVEATLLYVAAGGLARRPGEPLRTRLVAMDPGSSWSAPVGERRCEWLVLRGAVTLDGAALGPRDYHVRPAGCGVVELRSHEGALLFLRESAGPVEPGEGAITVRDADAGWPAFAPGIERRILWARDGQAAMLYRAQAGAAVPRHSHGHDEECLMVQGELFLDDVLLQPGDYQLAPAGTSHDITATDTGVVIYAHGDLELRFVDA